MSIDQILAAASAGMVAAVAEQADDGSMADRIGLEIALHTYLAEEHARLAAATKAAWRAYQDEAERDTWDDMPPAA